jgi:hypothetical protein
MSIEVAQEEEKEFEQQLDDITRRAEKAEKNYEKAAIELKKLK